MKKAFDQTVRDIKREVNKKVLKVPSIEQKVLDATSNEPWGPHGSHLADIAQATRNYHEYQMIMAVIWKRINDTGKNWRHVYKALTVLEYLVAHGSERVIDEIREHAYQISTLSDFQYIDSSGRDQGSNVRKKSQSLVVLVNDKERIQEVRQKAAANRDKYRNTPVGGMYRPSSYGDRYENDRYEGQYGNKDDDRNGYGKEREWGYKDDDKYGRYGDTYNRDGDRYGRDYEDRYSRDTSRDDDYRGRSRSIDDYQYGSRSRSSDTHRDHAYGDDGQYSSSRDSGARADDNSRDGSFAGKRTESNFGDQSHAAPPSYEEAVGEARSPVYSERDGEAVSAPKSSSPAAGASPKQPIVAPGTQAPPATASGPAPADGEIDSFDEFDPRNSFSAVATTSNGTEMDFLGSLSESFSSNALAIMPVTSTTEASDASAISNQAFDDPFGDDQFKAIPSAEGVPTHSQNAAPASFHANMNQSSEPQPFETKTDSSNFSFGDSFSSASYAPSNAFNAQPTSINTQFSDQEPSTSNHDIDILADILPLPELLPHIGAQAEFTAQVGQPVSMAGFPPQNSQSLSFPPQSNQPQLPAGFPRLSGQPASLMGVPAQNRPAALPGYPTQINSSQMGLPAPSGHGNVYGSFNPPSGSATPVRSQMIPQFPTGPAALHNASNYVQQSASAAPGTSQMIPQMPSGPVSQYNNGSLSNFFQQVPPSTSQPGLSVSQGALSVPQPAKNKDKFETKSTVWADTLSRGLVNLNISGPKTNPLADIGVDFDAINRKEKRMEKQTVAPVTSTIHMGKAMGSGSGIGRAGASAIRPPPNTMINPNMVVGVGGAPPLGIGIGGGINQHMGVGMNIGMGRGVVPVQQQQHPTGFPTGYNNNLSGGYNPMTGTGTYGQQQQYGGAYR